ncbi:MAG: hypothetical protein BGO29_00210 [Bacteroidales bacterium 36-12]|nr:MAG: hypothetical protein BGO29_00210 [Bacteroidales bacterium 36-12]
MVYGGGTWVVGTNHVVNLLESIEQGTGDVPPEVPYKEDGSLNTDYDTWKEIEGITLTTADVQPDYLDWQDKDKHWRAFVSINFSDKGYKQKVGTVISFIQPSVSEDDYPEDFDWEGYCDRRDIRWLESIDFSGNDFHTVLVDGGPYQAMILKSLNLSNNPNLNSLVIENCPDLEDVNVSYCELTFEQIKDIEENISLKAEGTFTYSMQGNKSTRYDIVDLNALLTANGVGTQVNWSVEPVSYDGNVYMFAEAQDDVILTLTNESYAGYSIQYNYSLVDGTLATINKDVTNCTINIENLTNPGKPVMVGDEVKITVTPNGYYNLVSFKIDGTDATLDANNQYILELEEGEYTLEATYNTEFSGLGSGTLGEPYQIANQLQLNQVRNYPTAYYVLTNDIALTLSGQGWEPIANFEGEFDGNGKAITGLMINRPNATNVGIFANVKTNGVVKNLAVNASTITSKEITGGIVGILSDNAKIQECFFSGTISCTGEDVGGIVGWVEGSALVENCYSSADVTAKDRAGGVVGRLKDDNAEVLYSYSTGVITATQYSAGGVVGSYNAGSPKITACFALNSSVSGNGDSKRIIGWDQSSVKSNNYAFSEMLLNESVVVDGTTTNSNGANISKANAKLSASYTSVDWDFDDIWEMGLGYTLPILRNVSTSAQPNALPTHLDNGTDVNANNEISVKVYPTITDGIVNVIDKPSDSMVYVFNLSGMRVKQTNTSTVDLSTLATGVYFMHIDNSIVKIIKR